MADDRTSPENLLAHAGWLRALALRLVRDADVADDLVQETWSASLRAPPHEEQPPKAWLAKVLVNVLRMRVRSDSRRTAREQATLIAADKPPTPELLVARAEAQRALVEQVLRLDEPYRGTVLMHFGEGMTLADIARAQGIPDGTVRWRLKVALDRLRAEFDARQSGRRALVLLAIPKGLAVAQKSKTAWLAIVALLLLFGGGALWMRHRGDGAVSAGGDHPQGGGSQLVALHGNQSVEGADPKMPAWLGQRGVRARRIAGKVVYRGAPVEGATVELASLASESGLMPAQRRTTNAAGEFDLGLQSPMEWSVRATAPARSGTMLDVDLRDPGVRSEQLVLELGSCDAAMYGAVRDASGGPIVKAKLARLQQGLRSPVPGGTSVTTDDKGAYELCVEVRWPGWVMVEVSAEGYGAIAVNTLVPGRIKVDFALVPEAMVVGRVVRDSDGEPVPGAHVFVPIQGRQQREGTGWRGAFTDDTGRFRIDRVAAGRHLVIARADGMPASRGVPITVIAGQTTPEIEIRLSAGARLTGTVVEKGKPVASAKVTAIHDDRVERTAISQIDGTFVLDEIPRGELRFTALPYDVISPTKLIIDQPEVSVTLEVEALGTITGKVTRGTKPAPGANIQAQGPNSRELDEVRSGADGTFEIRGLRAGPWTLFAGDERAGAFGRAPQIVDLPRGGHAEVTIDMAYSAAISGRVVDQKGVPVSGISVEFRHESSEDAGLAVTTDDGTFRATTMTGGGNYRPHLRINRLSRTELKPPGGAIWPAVALEGPTSEVAGVTLVVQLDRLAIAGKVVDADMQPVPDARVIAELTDVGPDGWSGLQDPATTTAVDGTFSIGDLSAGTYVVHARAATAEATLPRVEAGRSGVVIVLARQGAIDGTLTGFKQVPQVTASRVDANATPIAATVTGAGFSIRDLSPGAYIVIARTQSEAASATVEVASGKTVKVTLSSDGTGSIGGHVRDFKTGKPLEGVACRAVPRSGTSTALPSGEPARSDAQGAFAIAAAPAGERNLSTSLRHRRALV